MYGIGQQGSVVSESLEVGMAVNGRRRRRAAAPRQMSRLSDAICNDATRSHSRSRCGNTERPRRNLITASQPASQPAGGAAVADWPKTERRVLKEFPQTTQGASRHRRLHLPVRVQQRRRNTSAGHTRQLGRCLYVNEVLRTGDL